MRTQIETDTLAARQTGKPLLLDKRNTSTQINRINN